MVDFEIHIARIESEYRFRKVAYGNRHARREYLNELWKLMKHNDLL